MTARPHTILHNSVSLDGSVTGFEVDMATHYRLASSFEADAHLTGSGTALKGIDTYGEALRSESDADRRRPAESGLPPWVIVDSHGRLQGKLHMLRNSPFGGDPILLVSEATPRRYLDYLTERDYRHHCIGNVRVDLAAAMETMGAAYGFRTLLVDSGPGLNGALLNHGLIDSVSLLVTPFVVGTAGLPLLRDVSAGIGLKLVSQEQVGAGSVWLRYDIAG